MYKEHKDAIDLLYICGTNKTIQHKLSSFVSNLNGEKEELCEIFEIYAETIKFIYEIGNSLMREAFLDFVKQNQIPEDCYRDHIRIPSFILPEWKQLDDVVGKPKQDYWLNNALIAWFERKVDDRIKFIIEVGPLKHEQRLLLLNSLEENGLAIKARAKEASSMYTRIYTRTEHFSDWADKDKILRIMNKIYNSNSLNETLTAINGAIESIVYSENDSESVEELSKEVEKDTLVNAFRLFIRQHSIPEDCYKLHYKNPSFILPDFRMLEGKFGIPKWNWWLNNCLIMWFERLKDDRLKLIIEVGPLESNKRLNLLTILEEEGINISEKAKRADAAYTRIYTGTLVISDWTNETEVLEGMHELFNEVQCQNILRVLMKISRNE